MAADERKRRAIRLREVAQDAFGYDKLRPGQAEAIQSALAGHDTLAVMPTGSGKSAIYQIAGMMIEGGTVIVSPLIALQHDQLQSLDGQDKPAAGAVNSTLRAGAREELLAGRGEDQGENRIEFLFLAPEQLSNPETLARLKEAQPSLFVVDEAHCISEWGHDFRPDYLRLGSVIQALDHPVVLALTATAAPPVRDEIVERLGMEDARVIVRGFDRPNIWLGVETFPDEVAKQRALVERIREAARPEAAQPGIVYVATRKHAEEIADLLNKTAAGPARAQAGSTEPGIVAISPDQASALGTSLRAAAYHAGLSAKERERVYQAFMADELDVIVATVAFGMGVDKPNVRFVIHYDIPESVDSYYQEIGRGGRDGEPARAILFYNPSDLGLQKFLSSSSKLDADEVRQVAEAVHGQREPVDLDALHEAMDVSKGKLEAALHRLEEAGAVERLPTGEVAAAGDRDLAVTAQEAADAQERRRLLERSRVEMIRAYAETGGCRRAYILNYFGESFEAPCGNCDNCQAGLVSAQMADAAGGQLFPPNSRVRHRQWGAGQVVRYEGDTVVVLFEQVGYKTLATEVVRENGLLEKAEG